MKRSLVSLAVIGFLSFSLLGCEGTLEPPSLHTDEISESEREALSEEYDDLQQEYWIVYEELELLTDPFKRTGHEGRLRALENRLNLIRLNLSGPQEIVSDRDLPGLDDDEDNEPLQIADTDDTLVSIKSSAPDIKPTGDLSKGSEKPVVESGTPLGTQVDELKEKIENGLMPAEGEHKSSFGFVYDDTRPWYSSGFRYRVDYSNYKEDLFGKVTFVQSGGQESFGKITPQGKLFVTAPEGSAYEEVFNGFYLGGRMFGSYFHKDQYGFDTGRFLSTPDFSESEPSVGFDDWKFDLKLSAKLLMDSYGFDVIPTSYAELDSSDVARSLNGSLGLNLNLFDSKLVSRVNFYELSDRLYTTKLDFFDQYRPLFSYPFGNPLKIDEWSASKRILSGCSNYIALGKDPIADTNVHPVGPDVCTYKHWHGTFCGVRDPLGPACGWGPVDPGEIYKDHLSSGELDSPTITAPDLDYQIRVDFNPGF